MRQIKIKNAVLSYLLVMVMLAGYTKSMAKQGLLVNTDTTGCFCHIDDIPAILTQDSSSYADTSMYTEAIQTIHIAMPADSSIKAKARSTEAEEMRAIAMRFKDKVVREQYLAGRQNAIDYFDATYPNEQVAILTVLCWPAGLIAATVSDGRFPNENRLLTNDYQQFQNLNFRRGYMVQARKMKRKHIWRGFGWGIAIDLAFVLSFTFL